MAAHLGVDITTLRRWEKKPNFRQQWQDKVDDIQGSPERTQAVLDMLYNKATQDNDVKSAQLYLQATNRMAPPTVEVKTDRKMSEMSDAELDALIASVASREKETRTLKVV
jgi:DNA-binding transcriptional regulator YbjK